MIKFHLVELKLVLSNDFDSSLEVRSNTEIDIVMRDNSDNEYLIDVGHSIKYLNDLIGGVYLRFCCQTEEKINDILSLEQVKSRISNTLDFCINDLIYRKSIIVEERYNNQIFKYFNNKITSIQFYMSCDLNHSTLSQFERRILECNANVYGKCRNAKYIEFFVKDDVPSSILLQTECDFVLENGSALYSDNHKSLLSEWADDVIKDFIKLIEKVSFN